jgi:septal ring factor EnvC (AmiA/AmiB activator)
MSNGDNARRDIPPGVKQAVENAVRKEIHPLMAELSAVLEESKAVLAQLKSDDGLMSLQRKEELERCKKRLYYAEGKIKDLESSVAAHTEVSRRRKEDVESMKNQIAELVAEIGLLRSVVDNQHD